MGASDPVSGPAGVNPEYAYVVRLRTTFQRIWSDERTVIRWGSQTPCPTGSLSNRISSSETLTKGGKTATDPADRASARYTWRPLSLIHTLPCRALPIRSIRPWRF